MTTGDRIRITREMRGMSQQELALKCGWTSRSTISKIEKNICETRLTSLMKIAKALNVDPDYLVFGDEEDKKAEIEELFNKLSSDQQESVLAFLRSMLGERAEQ